MSYSVQPCCNISGGAGYGPSTVVLGSEEGVNPNQKQHVLGRICPPDLTLVRFKSLGPSGFSFQNDLKLI